MIVKPIPYQKNIKKIEGIEVWTWKKLLHISWTEGRAMQKFYK